MNNNIIEIQRTLFDFVPQKLKKNRPIGLVRIEPPVCTDGWQLEPHVCLSCFGRIASMASPGGATRYVCTNCGCEGVGTKASVICACGMKLHSSAEGKRVGPANRDAGIRCVANPKRSPEFPAEYVAAYTDQGSRK